MSAQCPQDIPDGGMAAFSSSGFGIGFQECGKVNLISVAVGGWRGLKGGGRDFVGGPFFGEMLNLHSSHFDADIKGSPV